MAWTAEDRRRYAPALQETLRQGMLSARLFLTLRRGRLRSCMRPRTRPNLAAGLDELRGSGPELRDELVAHCPYQVLPTPVRPVTSSRLSGTSQILAAASR